MDAVEQVTYTGEVKSSVWDLLSSKDWLKIPQLKAGNQLLLKNMKVTLSLHLLLLFFFLLPPSPSPNDS